MSRDEKEKPGNKQERDQLRQKMLSQGCGIDLIAEEIARRWGFRPRKAWRYANRLSQRQVAEKYNELVNNRSLDLTDKRISDYEKWPESGIRPTPSVFRVLACIYRTTPKRLIDSIDMESMSAQDIADIMVHKENAHYSAPQLHSSSAALYVPSSNALSTEEIAMVAKESSAHAAAIEQGNLHDMNLDQLREEVIRLVRMEKTFSVFSSLVRARNQIYQLLDGNQHSRHNTDLYFLAGVTCGALADAADCFGNDTAAIAQTRAAWTYASIIGHNSLRVWCRAMQLALAIADERPQQAVALARSGQKYADTEKLRGRMHGCESLALAKLGEKTETLRLLQLAQGERDRSNKVDELFDEIGGTYESPEGGFQGTKASILVEVGLAEKAVVAAQDAIDFYISIPEMGGDHAGQTQARIDLARALLLSHHPDGAHEALQPVIALPIGRRVDWLKESMQGLQRTLAQHYSTDSSVIRNLETDIEEFLANTLSTMILPAFS